MGDLTPLQADVVARIKAGYPALRAKAYATRRTRSYSLNSRRAAAMHLIGDMRICDAARMFSVTPGAVYQAVRKVRRGI